MNLHCSLRCSAVWRRTLLMILVVLILASLGISRLAIIIYLILTAFLSRFPSWGYGTRGWSVVVLEAGVFGFVLAWIRSDFVCAGFARHGWMIRIGASAVYCLQLIVVAASLSATRRLDPRTAVLLTTLAATLADAVQMHCGIAWPLMSVVMAVVDTPVSQWLSSLGVYGTSAALHFACLLWIVDPQQSRWEKVRGPLCGLVLLSSLWIGGAVIESYVDDSPPPLSALLVQPGTTTDSPGRASRLRMF